MQISMAGGTEKLKIVVRIITSVDVYMMYLKNFCGFIPSTNIAKWFSSIAKKFGFRFVVSSGVLTASSVTNVPLLKVLFPFDTATFFANSSFLGRATTNDTRFTFFSHGWLFNRINRVCQDNFLGQYRANP